LDDRKGIWPLKIIADSSLEDYSSNLESLSILTAVFPGEPQLAGFIGGEDDGGGGDNWSCTTCKALVKSSPPTNQYPTFYRPDVLPVAQSTVSKY